DFNFTASDGTHVSPPALISIAVHDQFTPVAVNMTADTLENTVVNITMAGSDPDGDTVSFSLLSMGFHGLVTSSGNIATYTPDATYHGADSFTYSSTDGTNFSPPATVTVTVQDNSIPAAENLTASTTQNTAFNVTLSASDSDSDPLKYTIVDSPSNGNVSISG